MEEEARHNISILHSAPRVAIIKRFWILGGAIRLHKIMALLSNGMAVNEISCFTLQKHHSMLLKPHLTHDQRQHCRGQKT